MRRFHGCQFLVVFLLAGCPSAQAQEISAPAVVTLRGTEPTRVTPRPVDAEKGIAYTEIVADFRICGGQTITSLTTTVDWHDGTPAEPLTAVDPLWQGLLRGAHVFVAIGQFKFSIRMEARCYRDWGQGHTAWTDSATSDAGIANVYAAPAVTALNLSVATVTGGNPVDATVLLAAPAPPSGATVMLSSSKPFATVQATIRVPANARRQTAPILTVTPTPAGQTATISAVTSGPARTRNLKVN